MISNSTTFFAKSQPVSRAIGTLLYISILKAMLHLFIKRILAQNFCNPVNLT